MKTAEKTAQTILLPVANRQGNIQRFLFLSLLSLLCCFVLVALAAQRVVMPTRYALPFSAAFKQLGAWLPGNLSLASDPRISSLATSYIEMFLFMALAFGVYAWAARLIWRQTHPENVRSVVRWIWLGTLVMGLLLLSMPVLLSQDVFVYADYGHVLVAYGANPFFVPPNAVSHDVVTRVDNWNFSTSAYGPVWMYICALVALVGGNHPTYYYVFFRVLACACHLLNSGLVYAILRASGSPPRRRAVGTLLYAWNPLALLESCLGAHNDVLVSTFLLLTLYLLLRAEKRDIARPGSYLAPLLACSVAVLVKFTTLPLLALFLVLLGRKTFDRVDGRQWRRWLLAVGNVVLAGSIFVLFALACYLPLWLGHALSEILRSFATPPSAKWAENSFLRVIQEWGKVHGRPAPGSLLALLSQRAVWDRLTAAALAVALLLGAYSLWRRPTVDMLARVLLAAFGVLLIVTPWFYPWYVQWLIALAAIILARPLGRAGRALLVFTLAFSVSAMLTYLDPIFAPLHHWLDTRVLLITTLPLLAALLVFLYRRSSEVGMKE